MKLPLFGQDLSNTQIAFVSAFAQSCRASVLKMVTQVQSGHPGGSLSALDYLALLYAFRVTETNERVVVSNGHISPAVYSVLAELDVIPKERVLTQFRRPSDLYEGHVNRRIQGIHFGTGPLGVGASVASGMAMADVLQGKDRLSFLVLGDGECQEGQVYEMLHFAAKYRLKNLIAFVDDNEVQLSDAISKVMPLNLKAHFEAAGWHAQEVDGHDFSALWRALSAAAADERPSVILGKTIMGHGVEFMAKTGRAKEATWHGKAPKQEEMEAALEEIALTAEQQTLLTAGLAALPKNIHTSSGPLDDVYPKVDVGTPKLYGPEVLTDCRSAYGDALLDLARKNPEVVALTADLAESVKTHGVQKEFPERHLDVGIAEQHMVSASGGLSLSGLVPFCSTFGAFMSSRAKDQARVNDINETHVKMVSTHCGLSVGEDGPTHQAIDDISSFSGFFHTGIFEPADPNHCDRIIRSVAQSRGNVYVRMGRAKIPVICKEDGTPFYDENYVFEPGKADVLRKGTRATIIASGPMVIRALQAAEALGGDIEVLAVGSFHPFDSETVVASVRKTGRVVTVHDHHIDMGLAHFVRKALMDAGLAVPMKALGVDHYQLSGTSDELYELAGLGVGHIVEAVKGLN